jgi:hypothetical protein
MLMKIIERIAIFAVALLLLTVAAHRNQNSQKPTRMTESDQSERQPR